jgi:hypothetical protein
VHPGAFSFVLFIFSQHPEQRMIPEESSGWVPFQMAPVSRAICFRSPFETKRRVLGINFWIKGTGPIKSNKAEMTAWRG